MRALVAIAAAVLVIWTGLWFFAADRIETGAAAVQARASAERGLTYGSFDVTGYPYRFAIDMTDAHFANPDMGLAWDLPRLNVTALSYRPNHLIATFPERQSLAIGGQRLEIASEGMQASLRAAPSLALPLVRSTLEGEALAVTSDQGWGLTVEKLIFASRRSEMTGAPENAHDVVLTVEGIRPDDALRARVAEGSGLPEVIGPVTIDATVALDAALDRHALAAGARKPELTALTLREASVSWGEARFRLSGALDFDAQGRAQGGLDVAISGWRGLLDLGIALGLVAERDRRMIETVMGRLDMLRFGTKELKVTLPVQDGVARVGPIPVLRLPDALRSGTF